MTTYNHKQKIRITMKTWIIKRDYTDDGVVGLNGDQYLLDNEGEVMKFQDKQEAVTFLTDNGIDLTADEGISICQQFSSKLGE